MLLVNKADINARNNNNQTALSLAMTREYNENIITLLKSNKAIK
jgi:ankyrin repeat protein